MAIIKIPDGKGGWIKFPTIKGDRGLQGYIGDQGVKGDKGLVIQEFEPIDEDVLWVNPTEDYPALDNISELDVVNIVNRYVPKFDIINTKDVVYDTDKIPIWDSTTERFVLVTKEVLKESLGMTALVSKEDVVSLIKTVIEEMQFRRLV